MTSATFSKMSSSLFLDTSLNFTVALLDDDFGWIDYIHHENKKSASHIHREIWAMFEKNGLDIENIATLFYCSGPGSYTGMRVGEGIAKLFSWQGKEVKSFYHYQIPLFCGVRKGTWVANAYKGEIFRYRWDSNIEPFSELMVRTDYDSLEETNGIFSHDPELVTEEKNTVSMIKESPLKVFPQVLEKGSCLPLDYFRLPENEFKLKSKKNK